MSKRDDAEIGKIRVSEPPRLGSLKANTSYDASVTANARTAIDASSLRYKGYYYDPGTGFYYLQSRYYDPQVGRFISPDSYVSTGQGFAGNNMLAYCNNNPIMCYDPTGHLSWKGFRKKIAENKDAIVTGLAFMGGGFAGVAIVNAVENYIYYTYFSDGVSDLDEIRVSESGESQSAYVQDGYISKYDRLVNTIVWITPSRKRITLHISMPVGCIAANIVRICLGGWQSIS